MVCILLSSTKPSPCWTQKDPAVSGCRPARPSSTCLGVSPAHSHLLGMDQFPLHEHFELPGNLGRSFILLWREHCERKQAERSHAKAWTGSPDLPRAPQHPHLQSVEGLEIAAPDSFSVECTEGKRWGQGITGVHRKGNGNSSGSSHPNTLPSKAKTTHLKAVASETTEGQGRREVRDKERHCISMFPTPEAP